jgi:hypothetical protein
MASKKKATKKKAPERRRRPTPRAPTWAPLLSDLVGRKGTKVGPVLPVHLAVLKRPQIEALLRLYGVDQGFFVHFVEGSMVSLTISPTRGGND